MQQILKANELPPGARMMGRQGRALNGLELADGLERLVAREVGEDAARSCLAQAANQRWYGFHLTYPNARLEWVPCEGGIWLKILLAHNMEWEFRWQDRECDIRNMRQMGPFASPDDFREALGLARIAQFKLPGGDVVTAELPGAALRPKDTGPHTVKFTQADIEMANAVAEVDRQMEELVKSVVEAVIVPEGELLAEPPTVEPTPQVIQKAKPVGAALKGKGGKKR